MTYITGDTHANVDDVIKRIEDNNIQKGDTLIVLGDFGANFFLNVRDTIFKDRLSLRFMEIMKHVLNILKSIL